MRRGAGAGVSWCATNSQMIYIFSQRTYFICPSEWIPFPFNLISALCAMHVEGMTRVSSQGGGPFNPGAVAQMGDLGWAVGPSLCRSIIPPSNSHSSPTPPAKQMQGNPYYPHTNLPRKSTESRQCNTRRREAIYFRICASRWHRQRGRFEATG